MRLKDGRKSRSPMKSISAEPGVVADRNAAGLKLDTHVEWFGARSERGKLQPSLASVTSAGGGLLPRHRSRLLCNGSVMIAFMAWA